MFVQNDVVKVWDEATGLIRSGASLATGVILRSNSFYIDAQVAKPLTSPVPKKGILTPKTIAMPPAMNNHATAWPTHEAHCVARRKLCVIPHKIERRIRPPSSGKPGIRLKIPIRILMGPSHNRRVFKGLNYEHY